MDFFFKALAWLKGKRTYLASAVTSVVAVVYAIFTFDFITPAAMLGVSAQAAALRAAIDDFKKAVAEKVGS